VTSQITELTSHDVSEPERARVPAAWTWSELWLANTVAISGLVLLIPDSTIFSVSAALGLGQTGLENVARVVVVCAILAYGFALLRRFGPSAAYRYGKYIAATVFVVFPAGAVAAMAAMGTAQDAPYLLKVAAGVVPMVGIALAGAFMFLRDRDDAQA